ncbi:MAG: hypothetical protein HQK49_04785 [Oligoflexia bacterium]|nr:hypothetical protein [Oligoflexia bacterium]
MLTNQQIEQTEKTEKIKPNNMNYDYASEIEAYRNLAKEEKAKPTYVNHTHTYTSTSASANTNIRKSNNLNSSAATKKTMVNVVKVGGKTTIGAGVGVLVGVFGAIAAASVLEVVVPALLITKVAGVVGGATGLIKGVRDAERS